MVAALPSLHDAVDEILPGLVADRRHLHEHPELGTQEHETARFVADRLRQLGVEDIRTGAANTGATGLIRGTGTGPNAGRVLLLRADMDALPIEEENDVEYRSQTPGLMHACGHDGHTAMLLATARLLMGRRDEFAGTVKLVFQPSEELPPGGAKPMIEAGVLEDPHVDAALGLHLAQEQPLGTIAAAAGPTMAAADMFFLTIQGRGGHGAKPHTTVDPIVVGAQIVTALQTIVSRERDPLTPAVVTVGAFLAGSAPNVIPDTATLRGTVRSFSADERQRLAIRIRELSTGIAEAMGATVELDYVFGYPATASTAEMVDIVNAAATEVLGADSVLVKVPTMGGEDMSYFLNEVPGAFFHVGSRNPERGLIWGHHHPKFDIDEAALGIGVEVMVAATLRYFATESAPRAI